MVSQQCSENQKRLEQPQNPTLTKIADKKILSLADGEDSYQRTGSRRSEQTQCRALSALCLRGFSQLAWSCVSSVALHVVETILLRIRLLLRSRTFPADIKKLRAAIKEGACTISTEEDDG